MSHKSQSKTRAFWPVIGFVLAVSLGVIAYVLGEPVMQWMKTSRIVPGFPSPDVPMDTWYWIARGVLFVVMLMFASLIVAAARPKQKSEVRETDLKKEREKMVRQNKARKVLQQQINRKMKDQ
jgi:uncharacterized membrane protein YhaH (DUF805 family)